MEIVVENINRILREIRDNKVVLYSIIFMVGLYTALLNRNISPHIRNLYNNKLFKLIIFITISYVATENIGLAVILLIMTLVILQLITYQEIMEEIKRKEEFGSEYMENPLLRENELREVGYEKNRIFDVRIPEEENRENIKKGEKMLEDSANILDDQISRYDVREQEIINSNNFEALKVIQSGINRSYVSNDGEYMNVEKEKMESRMNKIRIMENNGYIRYMRLIDFDDRYYKILHELYNELGRRYNELLRKINGEMSEKEFWDKFYEYKMEEYKLVKYVITLKKNGKKYRKEEVVEIDEMIEEIEEKVRMGDRERFYELLNNLTKIII